jgi:hypothetical protein
MSRLMLKTEVRITELPEEKKESAGGPADTATAAVSASDARFTTSGLMSAVVSQERLLRAMFLRARGQGGSLESCVTVFVV